MDLFGKKKISKKRVPPKMEKKANFSLGDNSEYWLEEIKTRLMEEVPVVSSYESFVDIKKMDEDSGDAIGEIIVGGKILFPFFVKNFSLKPLDIFIFKGKTYPATRKKLLEILYEDSFFTNLEDKKDRFLIDLQNRGNDMRLPSQILNDKLSSENFLMVKENKEKSLFEVNCINKESGEKNKFDLGYYESRPFFERNGINHKIAFDLLSKGQVILTGQKKQPYRLEFSSEKKAFDVLGTVSSGGSFVTFNRNGENTHEGFLINKIADENGELRESSLFISRDGVSYQENIKGMPGLGGFPLEKVGSELEVGGNGYFLIKVGHEKVAFGPVTIQEYPDMKNGVISIKVKSHFGKEMDFVFDDSRGKIASVRNSTCFVFPQLPIFVSSDKSLNLTKRAEDHSFFKMKKDNIFLYQKGDKFITEFKDVSGSTKISFDSKSEALINLYAKGIDVSTVADHILSEDDNKKWGFAAKLVWEARGSKDPVRKEVSVPKSIKEDGSLAGEAHKRTDHSDYHLEKKIDGSKLIDHKDKSLDKLVSTVNKKGYDFQVAKRNIEKIALINPKIASEIGFDNFFKKEDEENLDLDYFLGKLPEIKETEHILSSLLVETRSGVKGMPEKTLTNLVSSLGAVIDSLEVFRDAK